MKARTIGLALFAAVALPALAQTPMQTNLDPAAGRLETRNAQPSQLTAVTPEQARANELKRCDNLPEFYRVDCISRVNGKGIVSGDVIGGGLFKETVTTMPKATLDAEIRAIPPVHLPPQR